MPALHTRLTARPPSADAECCVLGAASDGSADARPAHRWRGSGGSRASQPPNQPDRGPGRHWTVGRQARDDFVTAGKLHFRAVRAFGLLSPSEGSPSSHKWVTDRSIGNHPFLQASSESRTLPLPKQSSRFDASVRPTSPPTGNRAGKKFARTAPKHRAFRRTQQPDTWCSRMQSSHLC